MKPYISSLVWRPLVRRGRSLCIVAMIAALTLLAAPLAKAAPAESTRFQIETITVEGADKISPEIVVSESLLQLGRSYTESELRDARYRIVRLPFVLDAEFALRKGSSRGLYELVIAVEDTRRWFFGVDLELTAWAQSVSFDDLGTDDVSAASAGLSGRRFSAGRHGVFFVALGGQDGSLQFGYTQYDLLGRSILLSASASLSNCEPEERVPDERSGSCRTDLYELGLDPTFSTWTADGDSNRFRLDLGVPVRGNQSVRLTAAFRHAESGFRRQAYEPRTLRFLDFGDLEETRINLSWVHNSIDEPVFPTVGLILEAGLNLNALQADLQSIAAPGLLPTLSETMDSREFGAQFGGTRYWPITRGQSLFAKAQLFLGRSDVENVPTGGRALLTDRLDVVRGSLSAGHAKFLKRTRAGQRLRELRWETDVELRYEETTPDLSQPQNPIEGYRIGTGISFRNTWGVFRFKVNYLDLEGR